jgi:hypothetical protein
MGLLDEIKNAGSKLEDDIGGVASFISGVLPVGAAYYYLTDQSNPAIADINGAAANIPVLANIQSDVKEGFEIGTVLLVAGAVGVGYVVYRNRTRIGNFATGAVIPGFRPF